MRPAIFLDRDGTVCREVGYVNHPSRLHLLPGAAPAICQARSGGYLCVLVTNQAGVARGYFTEPTIKATHVRLQQLLAAGGALLDGIYYCPHHPTAGHPPYRFACPCRKPRPGMLLQAARDLHIELAHSVVIGDKISDVEMGHVVGARGILVRTGYGRGEEAFGQPHWSTRPDHVSDGLQEAIRWIVEIDDPRRGQETM
ncbi:MAG: D-glycero-alpha-D-manno-heptose-1,7-bisphosphate 7-phosphatase [Acidobacteriota bacterium]